MEDVNKRRRISFLSLNLSAVLKKSTPGKFAYICHFQRIGINATKIEKTGIHFKTDISLPLPSSMLKLTNMARVGPLATSSLAWPLRGLKSKSRLVGAIKFCCRGKDVYKNSPVHTKRFVAAMCRRNVLLQQVARPIHGVICRRELLQQLVAWCVRGKRTSGWM